ncbi:unnamed protein product [Pleuronectes platessa]|uniref:Uncharacterized protein n=1 Tax=Pleuronectes platessa TaxID=8262 RepID=A0A9N7VPF2_PLEPL|nr:unnamed protein product [Pleuronectes platessa]
MEGSKGDGLFFFFFTHSSDREKTPVRRCRRSFTSNRENTRKLELRTQVQKKRREAGKDTRRKKKSGGWERRDLSWNPHRKSPKEEAALSRKATHSPRVSPQSLHMGGVWRGAKSATLSC